MQALVAALEQRLGAQDLHGVNAVQRVEEEVEAALLGHGEVMGGGADAASRQSGQQSDASEKNQRHQDERACEVPDADQIKQREGQIEHGLQRRA